MALLTPTRPYPRWFDWIAVSLVFFVAVGCTNSEPEPDDGRPLVVATTGPVGELVRNIAGDHARVEVLMGPGVDPHLYRELPADTEKLGRADVIFYNGLHLEGRMGDTLAKLGRKKPVYAVTEVLERDHADQLLTPPDFAGHADPHVWHDVGLWAECIPLVVEKLSEADPDNADAYRAAGDKYAKQLTDLDAECRERIAQIPSDRRVLVTAHDAFAYFSKAYGLEAVGLKGVSTEDEVDLKHMQEVIDLVVHRRIPCVFVESAVAPQIMQALAEPCRDAGHDVYVPSSEEHQLYADALGKPGSKAESYTGMIRANVDTIAAGLTGKLGGGQP
ncbi:Periplasmic zinc-binding protein TroA precursor [Posidoniimonas corsicana]|uniref:Periplasmic zinc-binding protein TroA n=1 Tax=Posidoniimonas corsicana TaxID=1938618 RepID=A0A5C5VB51_9BACT|nr:zinc ABC transporter substrate-binding protein [Posidoniimonas corsicana]TWT35521.1 Periplasmic zinc-binding protein TroA precursor [Posidoniimonas corsicana]